MRLSTGDMLGHYEIVTARSSSSARRSGIAEY